MAKRNQSGIAFVASMPWPVGIALGFIAYLAVRYGIGWYFTTSHNPYLSGLGDASAKGIYAPIGWMLLGGCWIAATASFFGQAKRRVLLDTQTGIDSLRRMDWKEFEMLAGEAFRVRIAEERVGPLGFLGAVVRHPEGGVGDVLQQIVGHRGKGLRTETFTQSVGLEMWKSGNREDFFARGTRSQMEGCQTFLPTEHTENTESGRGRIKLQCSVSSVCSVGKSAERLSL